MNFQLIGVNHNSASLNLREKLAIPESRLPHALQQLLRQPGVIGGFILSTCNRVEVMVESNGEKADLRSWLRDYFDITPAELDPHVYEYGHRDAIHHLFRVAASLDSMVVGEPQILGQVKRAYATARAVETIGSHLEQVLTRAIAVAKKVRTETAVGSGTISIASAAVELAEKLLGSLENKQVYLVGAGEMSELAGRHLSERGANHVFVSSRSYDRALKLANAIKGRAIPFEELYRTCALADIVITSTAAPHAIFRREHGELFLRQRQNRPIFFIDISVPRNVDQEMNTLDGIFVYDIDDLQLTVAEHVASRQKEAQRAEAIVTAEAARFEESVQARDVVPMIIWLQERMENIRQGEIERVRERLGQLSPQQECAIDTLTHGIVNKLMHCPITALKTAARGADADRLLPLVQHLFNIEQGKATEFGRRSHHNHLTSSSSSL